MVVVLKTPNPLLQNFFHYDVDLPIVSCNSMPWSGCPLRFGELVVITETSSANGYRNPVDLNSYEVTHGPKLPQKNFQKV
jgi:hypothetical protein